MLVDTDVLIWHLRGLPEAIRRLDQLPSLTISAVTYLELLQGIRNQAEMVAVQKSLDRRHAVRLPITSDEANSTVTTLWRHSLCLGAGIQEAELQALRRHLLAGCRRFSAPTYSKKKSSIAIT